jgi:alpha-glucosidase (family GH31 glycosyl hydrolase)
MLRFFFGAAVVLAGCGDDDVATPARDAGTPDAGRLVCTFDAGAVEEIPEPERHTPRWAFEPWISKDISDRADTFAFVDGFRERDIPVGVVVLDSPWETHYNTFIPNPTRYPDFAGMVEELHARDVRIVLWITSLTNASAFDLEPGGDDYSGPASNYLEGRACGFYVEGVGPVRWWKGEGAAVDFFDPAARNWWHRQQDPLLDIGVDGWKLDFGESYIRRDGLETADGVKTLQEYSEAYYRDFLAYGVSRRGREEFVTMVRGYDQSYDFEGRFFARPEHAPVIWMGDNHRDWGGVVDALDHTFRSALAGYVVVGSDIGGYLDRDELDLLREIPFDLEVFQRWTALGALMPFMQLHGRANLAPWTVPERADETVAVWQYWAGLHSRLVPFYYSLAEESYAGRAPGIVRPLMSEPAAWPTDWRYMLGDALLVAPLVGTGGGREVPLPEGADWFDWWTQARIPGGTLAVWSDGGDRTRYPLFVREGAILPMTDRISLWPGAVTTTFARHDADDAVTQITLATSSATLSRVPEATLLFVHAETAPASVTVNGTPGVATYDPAAHGWTIDLAPAAAAVEVDWTP